VAAYDWSIPVRADKGCEPLDLMKIGRTRFHRTGSLSDLIWTL
jgi:hypothetical protein